MAAGSNKAAAMATATLPLQDLVATSCLAAAVTRAERGMLGCAASEAPLSLPG